LRGGRTGPNRQRGDEVKRQVLSFFLLAGLVFGQAAPTVGTRALEKELAHASTDERIKAYQKLLETDPSDQHANIGLISAYLQKLRESGDFTYLDRATKLVDRLLEKDGGNFTALRFQNEIDLQRHDFKAVADRARDMLQYAPSDQGTWGNLGDASMELGEYKEAERAYSKMFALRPNLASYNRLAFYRFVAGDVPSAVELMRNAIDAGDPAPENTAWCFAELGDMYFKTGHLDAAADAYHSALDLFPRLHRAIAGLGKVAAEHGSIDAAIRYYEHAQAIVPLVEYAGALEDLYTAAGQNSKAQQQRDLLATIEKIGKVTNEKTNRNLALLLADHTRDLPLALELMQTEIPIRGDVYTWDALGWVLFKSGKIEEAKTASAKALKLGTPEPLFYYHARKIAQASGDPQAASQYAARLSALNAKFDFGKTGSPSAQ
jgi:tetratricopeptide (TPR) repeat protein